VSHQINIALPDGRKIVPKKAGVVNLGDKLILKEVLYTPTFTFISTWQLARDENCTITYGDDCCVIQDRTSKKPIGVGEVRNGVYYLKGHARGKAFTVVKKEDSAI